jgi:hypothetical protein
MCTIASTVLPIILGFCSLNWEGGEGRRGKKSEEKGREGKGGEGKGREGKKRRQVYSRAQVGPYILTYPDILSVKDPDN